ncbi:glycosyltransferase, partial [Propionibacterium sp.]|uniref:glycosyltransferase n=1 Tax=Propionibacterium sp. TaxID=1977903 RepID=UPI00345EC741
LPVRLLRNGVPVPNPGERVPRQGGPVEFLFLARLHPHKRPLAFVDTAVQLLEEGVDASFALVGPDGGEESAVRAAITLSGHGDRIRAEGALPPDRTAERLARADVHVLPSFSEVCPMSVLEAMSIGLPVIITESCGLADDIREHSAGIVVEDSLADLAGAMRELATDRFSRRALGANAARFAREDLSVEGVVEGLWTTYDAVARRG